MPNLRCRSDGFILHSRRSVSRVVPSPGGLLMKIAVLITASILAALLLFAFVRAQTSITPNTIRIQSLDDPARGQWVVMPGFSELGSPTFSRDGQWIAFDAYKQGFNNSSAECWIARRDGQDLKRLVIGATPRFSPDGKRLLFMRRRVNDPTKEEGIYVINNDGSGETRIGPG